MHGSTKALVAGVGCGLLALVMGVVGGIAFGDTEGGLADVLHLLQMVSLLAAVVLCVGGGVAALARRVGISRRTNA